MMATLPSLVVSAVTTFDGKALKKGEKTISGFAKKAGAALGLAFSTKAVVNFGKAAAKAFIADEKAANRLAISVKNLGLGFETPRIERYISELSALSGVADDQLRPSMQKLLQTVGSVSKAQELLSLATDVSAGSGVDFETVVSDLSRAYVGQTRGLTKYALGVGVAELKTMKFAEVQERLNKQFSGANAEYLTTYAGKLQLITTAAGEASEKIGGALVESLVSVFAAGDTTDFVKQIDTLATKIADTVAAVVFGFQKLYVLTSDRAILASFNPFDDYEKNALAAIEAAEKAAKFRRNLPSMGYQGSQAMGIYETSAQIAARKKAETDAIKRAKALAALQTKSLADAKKKAALEKAAGVLDLERIGITAALKGQISETDRLSLGLQLALLDKNDTAATKLSAELTAAVKRQNDLNALLLATPEAPNPYRNWKAPDMGPFAMTPTSPTAPTSPANPFNIPYGQPVPNFNVPDYAKDSYSQVGPMGGLRAGVIAGVNPPPINITVELDGVTVGSAIRDGSINDSLSGSFNSVNRSGFKGAVAI